MPERYVLVEDATVVNVVLWDGVTPFDGSDRLIAVPDRPEVSVGWTYDGEVFLPPPNPAPIVLVP